MLIARTEAALQYGLDEAIERCLLARELGAEMTLVIGLMNQEQAEYVAKYDKGWKMWPDVATFHGVPDVELKDIEPLGFNLGYHPYSRGRRHVWHGEFRQTCAGRSVYDLSRYPRLCS